MELGRLRKKYLGCIIGAAVGDAVGAPLEFWDRERLRSHPQGSEWITEMLPFAGMSPHPLGLWRADPPKGTGTDDTRLNQIFVEAVTKYGLQLNARLLAAEYVDRYVNRDQYYPGYHNLSTAQLEPLLAAACGELDMDCPTRPGVPPHVLRAHAGRSGVPIGWGLLCLP